ncbi:Cytochrome P450 107B1 [Nonomuraea coxensis DSM 45129]|uniref:Cytochrome P450 107B1 n=1 Tax=Nonomuraea coxensis DSM 45129 TaxID=1122611 RepID=A0ABX8U4L3_9ACTN|nr:cytochrome P450 [Nonomuraea coxensis]QYC42640.1 Cytochrome P450 107B1 [Nonomuraea coxensis DSM 45129]
MADVPELDMTDPALLRDPSAAYVRAAGDSPVARLTGPGFAFWVVLRHAEGRAVLTDPRLRTDENSYRRPDVPAGCLPYMTTMSELNGAEHARLRRLVAPAFTPRQAERFRPRVERVVDALLDELPAQRAEDGQGDGTVDLLAHFARPLPMEVICELVGIPAADRPRWRAWGADVAAGHGAAFAEAIPGILEGAKAAVARARAEPGDDLVSELARVQEEDGDRLSETELVTMVWQLVLAGQTPANLIANSVAALHEHPDQLAALRADPALTPGAVEELMRWCGPQLLTIPRFTTEDVEIGGVTVPQGEPVTVAIPAANRDPRVFPDPGRFDVRRDAAGQLGFAHGPHFCAGASLARVQTAVALGALLRRFPGLALAGAPRRVPDPGTARLLSLPVTLGTAG